MSKFIYEFDSPDGSIMNKKLSYTSRYLLEEATNIGMNWEFIPHTQLIELTYNGKKKTFFHQVPPTTTALANHTCTNKKITTNILSKNGISVPKGYRIKKDSSKEYLFSIYENLQKPLVVKPGDGSWGENITVDISDFDTFVNSISLALKFSGKKNSTVIAEEMFEGTEYRILATRDKVIGVLNRRPASVLGNGKDSIKLLIMKKNENPIRGSYGIGSHELIQMDAKMTTMLLENNMNFDSIPNKDERVFLRKVSNISRGGDAIDFTDEVHESVKEIALKAIQSIPGLSFAGVDFLSKDITKKQTKDSYTIIEINVSPGFDMHDFPYKGKNRHAAKAFLSLMFPELKG